MKYFGLKDLSELPKLETPEPKPPEEHRDAHRSPEPDPDELLLRPDDQQSDQISAAD